MVWEKEGGDGAPRHRRPHGQRVVSPHDEEGTRRKGARAMVGLGGHVGTAQQMPGPVRMGKAPGGFPVCKGRRGGRMTGLPSSVHVPSQLKTPRACSPN